MTSMEYPILFCVERDHDCVFCSEALVLGEDSISTMAPKRSHRGILGLGEVSFDNIDKGHVTRAHIQAQEAIESFKDFVPLVTRNEIESVVDCLCKSKAMPQDELCHEVEPWVVDLGNTAGRPVAYDKFLMLYWVNMNMIAHYSLNAAAK